MDKSEGADFGKLAVALGFLTKDDLQKAAVVQQDLKSIGVDKRLGEICYQKKLLSREQVLLVLRAQGKRILTCKPCRKTYNVPKFRLDKVYACRHCKAPLTLPTRPVPPTVNGDAVEARDADWTSTTRKVEIPEDLVHLLAGYEITECVGRGGMGTVYKARDTILERWVAVKLLAPFLATNREYIKRFFSEARNLQKLHHPNIVEAFDAGVAGDHKFFIMEFVEGQSLDRLLRKRGMLPERKTLRIVLQTAWALDYAWNRKIIHRDVKPQNVLLTRDRVVKLCDLGLSKDVTSDISLTMTDSVNCSPPYASPEQAQGMRNLDCRTDSYSLGVMFYQMACGELPFKGDSPGQFLIKHVTQPPPDPNQANPDLSMKTGRLILRMLEKKQDNRPTPGEVADLIQKLLNGQGAKS